MAYRFEPGEKPQDAVRRIALEQIEKAIADVRAPEPDQAAFGARKRFKKIRAVLKLVRGDIGARAYRRRNAIFRDFGRLLSDLRDSRAVAESLDGLIAHYGDNLDPDAFLEARAEFAQRHAAMIDWARDSRILFEDIAEALAESRGPIEKLSLKHKDFEALRGGLKRIYRLAIHRYSEAYKSGDATAFHEWRKPLKVLWLNARLFKPAWDEGLEDFGRCAKQISDLTGEDHNLAVLRQAVAAEPGAFGGHASAEALAGLTRIRSRELHETARPLAESLFAGPPKAFASIMARYWDRLQQL